MKLAKDAYTPDVIAASDCMLGLSYNICTYLMCFAKVKQYRSLNSFKISGKIGYGTVSEALAYKIPFVFVRRDYFNEEPFLRNMLEVKFSYGSEMVILYQ